MIEELLNCQVIFGFDFNRLLQAVCSKIYHKLGIVKSQFSIIKHVTWQIIDIQYSF